MSVIVQIIGGLGNQMFQYAAGKSLALRLGVPLKLDITGFNDYPDRTFKLGHFRVDEPFATRHEIKSYTQPRSRGLGFVTDRLRKKYLPWYMQKMIRERTFLYDSDIRKVKRSCYLEGYWQSEKYFSDHRERIKQTFTVLEEPDEQNREMTRQINATHSVSLHIRRGDYVHDPKIRHIHGVLSLDYYHRAIQFILRKVQEPVFYIFSDDIPWAKANLNMDVPTVFVDHNDSGRDYEDMRLMSTCRHHIIANSSFSWWGAWLGEDQGKTVVAPKAWFSDEVLSDKRTDDLIPEQWVRI